MSKRKAVSHAVISKKELLETRMEFLPITADGQGLFVKELGGMALLEYRELLKQVQKESGDEKLGNDQSIALVVDLVYRTACNEDGSPYFSSKEEVEQLANTSAARLQLIVNKATEISMGANKNLPNALNSSSTDS